MTGADIDALPATAMADPATAIVTLTVTEAGYHLRPDGWRRSTSRTRRSPPTWRRCRRSPVHAPPAGCSWACDARRAPTPGRSRSCRATTSPPTAARSGIGAARPGRRSRRRRLARLDRRVRCRSSTPRVDRITPRLDRRGHRPRSRAATGFDDRAPVVTEPFRDWVLSGAFPGRTARVGGRRDARFVDDIEPWERRKLWLLNGAHSLLAYAGLAARPHDRRLRRSPIRTCRDPVEALVGRGRPAARWTPPVTRPRTGATCWTRFANPAIRTGSARSPRTASTSCGYGWPSRRCSGAGGSGRRRGRGGDRGVDRLHPDPGRREARDRPAAGNRAGHAKPRRGTVRAARRRHGVRRRRRRAAAYPLSLLSTRRASWTLATYRWCF